MVRIRLLSIVFLTGLLQFPLTASGGRASPSFQLEPRPQHPQAVTPGQETPVTPPGTRPNNALPSPDQPARHATQPVFSVVIDAAHGGSDTGARIAPNLLEKDLTLILAKKLRQELQTRHIAVTLLRDSDSGLTFDQRAVAVNLARPTLFITLHAEPGSIIRIYTSALNLVAESGVSATGSDKSGFLPWDSAQSVFQKESGLLAATTAAAIEKRELRAVIQPAFLEPLHSIAAAAVALEAPADKKGFKIPADLIAGALADAIAIRKMNSGAAP